MNNNENQQQVNNTVQPTNVVPQSQPVNSTIQTQSQVANTPSEMPTTPPVEVNNNVTEVPTGNEEITVVNTEKKRTSSIVMIILVAILIAFVFNIDKVIEYYDNYMSTGSLTSKNTNETTNNLVNGYILIGDSISSIEIDKIKFYNFKKKEDESSIIFNYESSSKYDNPSTLNIYIEFYNSEKEIIYKELFNVGSGIEKDVVRTMSLNVPSEVLQNAQYALVKKYTNSEMNSTQTLTCKYNANEDEQVLNYNIVYSFKNNELVSYIVNKQILNYSEDSSSYKRLNLEYNMVSQKINAVFEAGNLNYTVNLEENINDFTPLYEKGTLITIIKNKEKLKEWVCE